MCRNKKKLALLLALCLPFSAALAQSDSLISDEMIRTETVNYSKTAVVENGIYERTHNVSASVYYPHTYTLQCEVDNASFEDYHVNRRQQVKAGDVLATFTLAIDEEALASTQLELERTRENYQKGVSKQEEDIGEMLEQRTQVKDAFERELLTLRIQRAQLAFHQYCYQQETQIANLEEQLEEMQEKNSQTQLIAPFDGTVTELEYKREGERVYNGETLVTMYREDGMLLRIDNTNLYFRYGTPVTVNLGNKNDPIICHGRVVAADNLLLSSRRLGHAFIQLEDVPADARLTRLTVSGTSQYLENVMIIPRRAITLDGGKYYVEGLFDGSLQKRFVNVGLLNTSNVWVLQGIQPGDTVVID